MWRGLCESEEPLNCHITRAMRARGSLPIAYGEARAKGWGGAGGMGGGGPWHPEKRGVFRSQPFWLPGQRGRRGPRPRAKTMPGSERMDASSSPMRWP